MRPAQLKIVSFNIWDLPYWFVKNREQRILQIAEYLRKLDAEIVCLQESFDVRHRRFLYESLGSDKYYASDGFETTRKAPLALFDTQNRHPIAATPVKSACKTVIATSLRR